MKKAGQHRPGVNRTGHRRQREAGEDMKGKRRDRGGQDRTGQNRTGTAGDLTGQLGESGGREQGQQKHTRTGTGQDNRTGTGQDNGTIGQWHRKRTGLTGVADGSPPPPVALALVGR
eukprot:TRINITY_DN34102_c0_g1_i3.p3 TRINITY_DN34102_c0_g1~~TRINITY_DN34102_c0_g1_i3.p3  ORF type:complete len:117 (-),score=21.09 TRINITY_DN34102_c0_g1_i3:24-374(-)